MQTRSSRLSARSFARVKILVAVLSVCLLLGSLALHAQTTTSTIDSSAPFSWAANFGWTNWRPSSTDGAVIGEYVLSGYLYAANVGWISLGSGAPANGIQYANNSASDFGVNFLPSTTPGVALLRGYAYGANIGWINFEGTGNPQVNLQTGALSGYAWSANCGWINLGTGTIYAVKTLSISPGRDSDGDGIADAFELTYFGNLTTATATSDFDGDGVSDRDEYLEGTNPKDPGDRLRIVSVAKTSSASQDTTSLLFTSTPTRLYNVQTTTNLLDPGSWGPSPLGTFLPDAGPTTGRDVITGPTATQRFYRVQAIRPLSP